KKKSILSAYYRRQGEFSRWCESRQVALQETKVHHILTFLQEDLIKGLSLSSLKVQAATLGTIKGELEGFPIGCHLHVINFFKVVRLIKPPFRLVLPQWDLNLVFNALIRPTFEHLTEIHDQTLILHTIPGLTYLVVFGIVLTDSWSSG
uniref:Uncharacterized protein n=1 Tax=Latimeria chalumnae TaxID=7897 RepID=H3AFJ4_LATCH